MNKISRQDETKQHSPLSITYITGTLSTGGTERHVAMVSRELVKRGHTVTIHCLLRGGTLEQQVLDSGVIMTGPRPGKKLDKQNRLEKLLMFSGSVLSLYVTLLFRRPHIVHFFLPGAYLVGGILARLAGLRRLVMSRRSMNKYQKKHPWLTILEYRLHRRMTAILGNSDKVVEELVQENIERDKLGLIYNGIDLAPFSPENRKKRDKTRASLGIAHSTTVITIVANLIPYKGHMDLLEALGRVKGKIKTDWVLLVVGRDDGIGNDLEKRANTLGIADNIKFLGLQQDIPRLLMASEIGVLCSHEEGFSNALLEGMAAGLPMVTTDTGGNAEAVVDGITGLVVPVKSPDKLGQALLSLIQNPVLSRTMGDAGRLRIENNFSLETCINHYEIFYQTLMADNKISSLPGIGLTHKKTASL